MPVYDFKCKKCGRVSEVLVLPGKAGPDVICPECGSSSLERLISASCLLKTSNSSSGETCCGRTERCDKPSCSSGEKCTRD